MTYAGPRLCDCGCRRRATSVIERVDLAFSELCRHHDAAHSYFSPSLLHPSLREPAEPGDV